MNVSDLPAFVFGILSAVLILVVIFQNRVGVVRKEIARSENRLSKRIDDLKKDMDTRMDRIERLIERVLFPNDNNSDISAENKPGKKDLYASQL